MKAFFVFLTRQHIPIMTCSRLKRWSTSIVGEILVPAAAASIEHPLLDDTEDERMTNADEEAVVGDVATDDGGGGSRTTGMSVPKKLSSSLVDRLASCSAFERSVTERSISLMVRWAAHMNIPAIILPTLPQSTLDRRALSAYARLLTSLAAEASASNVQLWLRVPFEPQALAAFDTLYHTADMPANLGCLVCFTSRIDGDLSTNTPLLTTLLHKFVACNTRALSFDTNVFLTNKRGYPTLSKTHQILFMKFLKRLGKTLRVIVEGGQRHFPPPPQGASSVEGAALDNAALSPNGITGCLAYLQYLRYLRSRTEVVTVLDTLEAAMEAAYLDQLQSPLQPLADDLEFCTYETFEKDPVKYATYQKAVEKCLLDMLNSGLLQPVSVERQQEHNLMYQSRFHYTHTVTILIVGAGRGPLVRSALFAVEAVNTRLIGQQQSTAQPPKVVYPRLIALEKNVNAVLFLRSLRKYGGELWEESDITIVHADVRNINPAMVGQMHTDSGEPMANSVDIMVSELLGSFGDNELSPECLQAAGRSGFLKNHGVCIPQSYQSFAAPVSSMRLYTEARAQAYTPTRATDGPAGQPFGMLRAMETPYVVRPYAASQMFTENRCFEFLHENFNPSTPLSSFKKQENEQFATLEFSTDTIAVGCGCGYGPSDPNSTTSQSPTSVPTAFNTGITIHGFLGTFEAILYRGIDKEVNSPPIIISTRPTSFSTGMFSWFPLYFPLKAPIHVPYGTKVCLNVWRRGDSSRVWYEWSVEVVLPTNDADVLLVTSGIHNPNGRSYYVSL